MILKASQRGGGQDLAVHLMRLDDNDHVSLHELRGFASDTLKDAFKETEAISRGTKCRQYLFSLSFSPPEGASVPVAVFEEAIDRIEERVGLEGQPRAIVFHEKEGRRHAHCVWSRIDPETMTAHQLSFFKQKLMKVSRDLYLEHGWKMPRGLENSAERNPTNFTLAEWQQAKRQGMDPRWIKQVLQECWKGADNRQALARSLEERGFLLAKGDKRSVVVLDHAGEVYSLPRMLDLKTKEVRARLGETEDLPSVAESQAQIGQRMTPAIHRHVDESRSRFARHAALLREEKEVMTKSQRKARASLVGAQKAEWITETKERAARLPTGLRGLWHRITGKYQEARNANEEEAKEIQLRHARQRQSMIDAQLEERRVLQSKIKLVRGAQAEELLELRKEIGRFLRFTRSDQAAGRAVNTGLSLKLQR